MLLRLPRTLLLLTVLGAPALAQTPAPAEATPPPVDIDAAIAAMEAGCAANAEARQARHAAKPLFVRLGGDEKILALTTTVVRLHRANPAIQHLLEGVDDAELAKQVALFLGAGTGGPTKYEGPSLADSHRHLALTNADFLAAGGDIVQAMQLLEHGQEEIEEVICALVSMRDQVVLPKEPEQAP